MEHIHVALVGGQAYPVYLAIKALKPTDVVLVHSAQSETEAQNIIDVVNDEGTIPSEHFRKVCLPTTDMMAMAQTIAALDADISDAVHCSVNLTGGTKLWSVLMYKYFLNRSNTDFYYVDQNCALYNIESLEKHDADVHLDAKTIFRLYGTSVKSYTPIEEYTEADFEVMRKTENLRRFNTDAYNKVGNPMDKGDANRVRSQRTGRIQCYDSYAEWSKNKDEGVVDVELYRKNGMHQSDCLSSPHAVQLFFFCHWFELKVASVLQRWRYAKEVWLNVEFPYKNNNPKNEIDIVVNTGTRLLFVECKTKIKDNTNIDKFSKAVKNYSGMASKALFVSLEPLEEVTKEKCEQNDVMHFSLMHRSESELFKMLDRSLNELNKR